MSTPQLAPLQHSLVGGKYQLREVIGSGGVGTVYRAKHLWTQREVAIKVLDPGLPHFDQLRDAFLREARASVQLDHPNVVDVLDMGGDELGTTYMVMELLDGPTLRDVLLEQGRLSERDTASILLPLVHALEKAHALGIVHKDFKPENIILSIDGYDAMTPKLLDFGVAQVVRESRPRRSTTAREVIVGTPQYMAPEQARDQRHLIGPQTDVWGVAVVWYECLTGRCPFDAETPLDVLHAVCESPIDFSGISERLSSVLRTALERPVHARTPNLAILRAELEAASASPDMPSTYPSHTSSHPPGGERPSYVRRTLQGVGPISAKARPMQLDSELLTLPKASHRRAALGGLALAVAIGLGAWWTIDGATPDAPAVLTPSTIPEEPTAAPTAVAPIELSTPRSTVAEEPTEPEPSAVPDAAAIPEPSVPDAANGAATTPAEPTRETVDDDEEPLPGPAPKVPPVPAAAGTEPTPNETAATHRRRTRSRTRPSSEQGYEELPKLVTEW